MCVSQRSYDTHSTFPAFREIYLTISYSQFTSAVYPIGSQTSTKNYLKSAAVI